MAQNIAFFLFSRKLLQDTEKKEARAEEEPPEKAFDDIPLSDEDEEKPNNDGEAPVSVLS